MYKFTAANQQRHRARRLLWGLMLVTATTGVQAQSPDRALQALDFVALDGGRVLMTLTLSDTAPEPSAFTVDKPARLSLDLPGTRMALPERYRRVNVGNVRAVAAAEAQGRTRVVVELGESAPYTLRVDGNRILLQLDTVGAAAAAVGASAHQPAGSIAGSIAGVDFRRGDKGEGRVVLRLSDPKASVQVRDEGGKVIARLQNTRVPEPLARRLDVLDFATPVKFVDVIPDGNDTRIVVTPVAGKDFEHAAYQAGDQFTIELQPLTDVEREERRKAEPQFSGERISLSFQNVEVRSLLQIIADVAGTNMVISDSVKGQMAMRLENVPWDQALDIVLRSKGLGLRQQGNVMLVAPIEEIAQREKIELEALKQKTELAPLRSEIIQINYAKASDLRGLLSDKDTSILSERGRISVDSRTNNLLVLETRDKIDEIRALVTRLDIPVRQVLVEARVVLANDDFSREIGTRFGVSSIGTIGNNTPVGQSGGLGLGGTAPLTPNEGSRAVVSGGIPTVAQNYIVSLPAAGAAGAIGWTILGSDFLIDLELSALQQEGRGELISSPRVVTQNGLKATIKQGFEVPYETISEKGTNVQFKDALLQLEVTPLINPNNTVSMNLKVSKDEPDFSKSIKGNPPLNKREVMTTVQVASGETVVLGGTFESSASRNERKVPLLGDIPLIGALFRNKSNVDTKRELLIFVTPKVLQEGLTVK